MITVMTHIDSDGVISFALFLKKMNGIKVRGYFTTPVQLRDTICYSSLRKKELGELYIFDVAGENRAIYAAAMYDRVTWIDHHNWEPETTLEHVNIVIDRNAKSAAHVVAEYFGITSPLVALADEIDTNSIKSEDAERIRTTIGAIRFRFSGAELSKMLYRLSYDLMSEDLSVLDRYEELVKDYRQFLTELKKRVREEVKYYRVNNLKVAVFESTGSLPVYVLTGEIDDDTDLIAVMIYRTDNARRASTKLEFRTNTDLNVLKIARFYGGGGHVKASGATV
ncbi:MAG: phosphoesterase, partial [Euryarchaeota archaeon]|nr:phosphoesterase [Euryarchaeota archaeon]